MKCKVHDMFQRNVKSFKRGVKEANKMSVNTVGRSTDIEIRYL